MNKIGIWSKIFGVNKGSGSGKQSAAVFVDFEHWYISLEKLYGIKPDIKNWSKELNAKYDVREMTFFADFSVQGMQNEISKIREVTNMIVQTQNTSHYKKDFTDFIMLDLIYQRAFDPSSAEVFIIFTGDGHFSSAARFLKNRCNKQVGIYAVKNAFSKQLQSIADWSVEVEKPPAADPLANYYEMILKNFKYLENQNKKMVLSFNKTVQTISGINHVQYSKVQTALKTLMKKGYVFQKKDHIDGNPITTLAVNWELVKRDGFEPVQN
ncbi:MAG TPA: NYN domain-containing protein [Oscillospiraceae bacterium]|nr:NYN domain-containing protein [Oscillospiraceae bacterium]HPS35996.1 NYN domain-containing protein [Oscillospiraceae bacterium]